MQLLLRRLWPFVRPYRGRLFLGLLCGVLSGLANGALMLVVRQAVDLQFAGSGASRSAQALAEAPAVDWGGELMTTAASPSGQAVAKAPALVQESLRGLTHWLDGWQASSPTLVRVLIIAMIPAVMLFRNLFAYLNLYLMNWSAVRAVTDLRTRLFDHLQNLSQAFFSQARTGDLIARITSDTQVLYGIISGAVSSMIKDPVTVLGVLGVMIVQPGQRTLALVSLVVMPACLIPITIYARRARKSARSMQSLNAELTTLMHESFTGNRIIKAYNLEATVLKQFRKTTADYVSHVMRVLRANEIPSQVTEFLGVLGAALVLVYVALVSSTSPGNLVAYVASVVVMYPSVKNLTRLHNQLNQAAAASQKVFELLQLSSTVAEPAQPVPLEARGKDIHFEKIDFDYGDKPVFTGFDLLVKAGQMVALVGSSGSGKTTLANLLLRFYDPKRGAVRIGGIDIREVSVKELRRQIALVAQESILFNDTIRNNIALGRPGASPEDIEAAARHAYAHEFILQKPNGYDTVVGEKGAVLSVGQRQRITIARAILRDAPILVLDEATSALDTESERAVQAALEELMQGRTTICIAHRLSTIQRADVIVVLDRARIVETGTHAELVKARGHYYRFYELQNPR